MRILKNKTKKLFKLLASPRNMNAIKLIQTNTKIDKLIITNVENSTIILNKDDYDTNMYIFRKTRTIKSGPENIIENKLKAMITHSNIILHFDEDGIINMNPTPPKLHGFVKVHKKR